MPTNEFAMKPLKVVFVLAGEQKATEKSLRQVYCYRVAGTVGIMTLPVLGFDPMQNFTEELQAPLSTSRAASERRSR